MKHYNMYMYMYVSVKPCMCVTTITIFWCSHFFFGCCAGD